VTSSHGVPIALLSRWSHADEEIFVAARVVLQLRRARYDLRKIDAQSERTKGRCA
jgi:hypothetical protein